jgi:putative effector of murein hydrolase LrgA (UPF0299 family)
VGVTLHLGAVAQEWPAILAAVVLGTLTAMIVTAFAFRWLARLTDSEDAR